MNTSTVVSSHSARIQADVRSASPPRLKYVTLPVSCVASRVTRMSRSVYELIDVSTAPPEVELHRQVAEEEFVVEVLVELPVLLALADVHAPARSS